MSDIEQVDSEPEETAIIFPEELISEKSTY